MVAAENPRGFSPSVMCSHGFHHPCVPENPSNGPVSAQESWRTESCSTFSGLVSRGPGFASGLPAPRTCMLNPMMCQCFFQGSGKLIYACLPALPPPPLQTQGKSLGCKVAELGPLSWCRKHAASRKHFPSGPPPALPPCPGL